MAAKLKFNFLKDTPLSNVEGVFEFYHKTVAPALQEILENESCVHTIGLFSKWGTGKSTVIEMIRNDLQHPMFIFDAWKYQEDSLRRIFLLEFIDFISTQEQQNKLKVKSEDFEKVKSRTKSALYKSTEVKTIEPQKSEKSKSWTEKISNNKTFLLLILFPIFVLVLVFLVGKKYNVDQVATNITNFLAGMSLLAVVLSKIYLPLLGNFFRDIIDKITKSVLPIATIRETIEREERLNSPEQFEKLFRGIIDSIDTDKKVIIVFDNIDRVHGDTAIKILSTIKTFLDPKDFVGLTFIVPCDAGAINSQIRSFYKDGDREFDPSEYLRKLFNVIIWMPEFIESDLHAFIKKVTEDTGEIKELLQQEDVAFVIGSAFSNNPREIKQFINNLISALVLASKTEVWERVKSNVSYLAKVLILRQKYPDAYLRLKDKWFEPENILEGEDTSELRNFMLNTSRITVTNAEPFVYFKEPTVLKSLSNSEGLVITLVEGNNEKAKEIIQDEKDQQAIVDLIELLFQKYRSQRELLKNIFVTHLEVFSELKIVVLRKSYYETLAKALDADLWQFVLALPTDLIFSNLLAKKELDGRLQQLLIRRYALSLGSEEVHRQNNLKFAKDVLTNLKQNINFVELDDRVQIGKFVDDHYSNHAEILSIFETFSDQEIFITTQAFGKFIASLDVHAFLNGLKLISQFKEFLIKNNQFDSILQKITELIQDETTADPNYRSEKETLMEACSGVLSEFRDDLEVADEGFKIQLIRQLIQAFNGIRTWDDRTSIINNLRWLSVSSPVPQRDELNQLISAYFQHASVANVKKVLDFWENDSREQFINDFFAPILQRSLQDETFFDDVYKRADKGKKIELITNLINQQPNSLNFIKKLGNNLPDRKLVVKTLLNKLASIPFDEQVLIYDYLPSKLRKSDPIDLKDQIVNQIKALLKSDTPASQEAGLNLLLNIDFLSEDRKREIGQDVLDWLRQSGKILNSNHKFVFKSILSLIPIMQEAPVSDFTSTLFDMLKQDGDKQTLEVSLEMLDGLKPKYTKYEKEFRELLDRFKVWPQDESRTLVIESIKNLKSRNPGKNEKEFWKNLGAQT